MPDINMQVFEEAKRNQLVTEVDIQTQVALDDYQVQLSDIANPTQSQDNVVIDRHGEFLPHWNESLDFDTWVKMSMEVAGKQLLMFRGNSSVSSVSSGSDVFEFFDDFETAGAGDWTTVSGSPDYDSTTQAKSPTHSLQLTIGSAWEDTKIALTSSNAIAMEEWTYADYLNRVDQGFTLISHGNGSKRALVAVKSNLDIMYYDGAFQNTGVNAVLDQWKKVKFYDFDWSAGTFKMSYDGNVASCSMVSDSYYTNEYLVGVYDGSAYYDDFFVRKYNSPEPTYLTDGEEQNIAIALKSLGRAG